MQFINIVVHSVEDMNFRVHLQFDFTKLCLDDYLDVSRDKCIFLEKKTDEVCNSLFSYHTVYVRPPALSAVN